MFLKICIIGGSCLAPPTLPVGNEMVMTGWDGELMPIGQVRNEIGFRSLSNETH